MSMFSHFSKKELTRFLKFSTVGGMGALIDIGVLNLLIFGAGWNGEWERIGANMCSVSLAILFNFTLHRYWTFPESKVRDQRIQLMKFVTVSMIGLLINTSIFYFSYSYLYSGLFTEVVGTQVAKATAIGLTLFWNFTANRLWTYGKL